MRNRISSISWKRLIYHILFISLVMLFMVNISSVVAAFQSIRTILNFTSSDIPHPSSSSEIPTNIFLPLISYGKKLPDIRSPFSVQIATLHQVTPDMIEMENGTLVEPQTEADWYALYESTYVTLTTALRESGADWVRVRVEWEMIEPNEPELGNPPNYVWGPYYDSKLALIAEAGVRLIATVADSPSWAARVPCEPIYPDRLDEFARFLTDLINRYKGPPTYIKHWELFNEPDSNRYWDHQSGQGCWAFDGDQYARMLEIGYAAIKAADPEATVLMGGIAYDWFTENPGGVFNRYFPDDVMANGGGAYIDAFNFHYFHDFRAEWERWDPNSWDRYIGLIPAPTCGDVYDGQGTQYEAVGMDVVAKTTHFRNRMDACFGVEKPVWITEFSGGNGDPEDQEALDFQARYVIKGYARALSAGVKNITWFSLEEPPYDPNLQSLLYADFSPKPAFFAYQTLTAELDGYYNFSHDLNICSWDSGSVSCTREAYVFRNDSQAKKILAWGSTPMVFQADQLRVVDRQGNETYIQDGGVGDEDGVQNGSVELQLTDEPLFISTR